jgi:FixJ family two-component response regulator
MMTGHADKMRVTAARDAGVTEFVAKPITAKAILDRTNAVIFKPRQFVKAAEYLGPCRRRAGARAVYNGPFRRASDHDVVQS